MQGAWVQSLVREWDPTCHNYEFTCCNKDPVKPKKWMLFKNKNLILPHVCREGMVKEGNKDQQESSSSSAPGFSMFLPFSKPQILHSWKWKCSQAPTLGFTEKTRILLKGPRVQPMDLSSFSLRLTSWRTHQGSWLWISVSQPNSSQTSRVYSRWPTQYLYLSF